MLKAEVIQASGKDVLQEQLNSFLAELKEGSYVDMKLSYNDDTKNSVVIVLYES